VACRDSKASYATLGLVDPSVHCDTCTIDFSANFSQSVEVTFRPAQSIRAVRDSVFCINAPQATPHVAVQQLLQPGESRTARPQLEDGRYRLRALEIAGGQTLRVGEDGEPSLQINVDEAGWPDRGRTLARQPEITATNTTDREQLVMLERMAWTDQAATAADVTTLQRFHDLFSEEALRPGERVSVGNLTVLFTDLRSSTRLYRDIGDAPAFGLVMNHFDVLKEAVAANDGAIVKNIGDAIMAVFTRPVSALRAVSDAQWRLANPGDGGTSLVLKAGIHAGPCIAVTLSERLDYFGSTVNIAARLEAMSSGSDIVVSNAVYRDAEVAALVKDPNADLYAEATAANLKGFDDEEFDLWLVKRRER
jgi:class 3 adenylate cyclase